MSRKKYEVLVGTRGVVYTGGAKKSFATDMSKKGSPPHPLNKCWILVVLHLYILL